MSALECNDVPHHTNFLLQNKIWILKNYFYNLYNISITIPNAFDLHPLTSKIP